MKLNKFFLLVLFASLNVEGASFDCAKASTNIEKTICSSKFLGSLDEDLSYFYNKLRKSLPQKESDELLTKQRNWIRERNKVCGAANDKIVCLRDIYWERIRKLRVPFLSITQNNNNKLCNTTYELVLSGKETRLLSAAKSISEKSDKIVWHRNGYLQVQEFGSERYTKERFSYSYFDIDNDGDSELVLFNNIWISQEMGRGFLVLNNKIPMDGNYRMSTEEFNSLPGITSRPHWPYRHLGLNLVELDVFKYGGSYYVEITDTLFGKQGYLGRATVFAKFSNNMLTTDHTSDLDVQCVFRYKIEGL